MRQNYLDLDHSTKWVFRFVAVSRLLQKSRVRPAWQVCTILRSSNSSAKMWRRRNYLDDSVDNIFVKGHFEIWKSSPFIDKDISLAIAMIENVTVHAFALKKNFVHGRWIANEKTAKENSKLVSNLDSPAGCWKGIVFLPKGNLILADCLPFAKTGKHLFCPSFPVHSPSELVTVAFLMSTRIVLDSRH